jgi:hypothetical protein
LPRDSGEGFSFAAAPMGGLVRLAACIGGCVPAGFVCGYETAFAANGRRTLPSRKLARQSRAAVVNLAVWLPVELFEIVVQGQPFKT